MEAQDRVQSPNTQQSMRLRSSISDTNCRYDLYNTPTVVTRQIHGEDAEPLCTVVGTKTDRHL